MSPKKTMMILVASFLVVFGWLAISGLRSRDYGTLKTIVIPDDSVATLDGKKVAINRSVGVSPGKYTLSVSRSGFATNKQSLSISKGEVVELHIFLTANNDEGREWQKNHPAQMAEIEGYASRAFDQTVKKATEQMPLIKYLPFIDLEYRIDYGNSVKYPNDPNKIAIYIKYWSEQGKEDAIKWIKFKGYDPDKLEIIYTQGSNTFQ